jgi:hypothetical protein
MGDERKKMARARGESKFQSSQPQEMLMLISSLKSEIGRRDTALEIEAFDL